MTHLANTLLDIPSRFTTPLLFHPKTGRPVYLIGGGSQQALEIPEPPAPVAPPAERTFSAEDIAKARQEEKDKVYSRLTAEEQKRKDLEAQVSKLLSSQQEREAAEAAAREKAEADARAKAEQEMSAKELLAQREQDFNQRLAQTEAEFQQKFQQMQSEREQERVLLEKDRQLAELTAYAQRRVSEEAENIAPQLRDFIAGNSPEEIEQSIETVKAKSLEIAAAAKAAMDAARAQSRGVAPTGYAPVGPMEIEGGTRQYSAQDIAAMDMNEYAKLRQSIGIGGASNNRGLYG